ncbi:hypothetical protein FIBSPDRAFT_914864 [Athelia psychrophila]|uniref:Uncharacterized protein n=1 Tax=Athelia psychrophila TaxID=1759441 RepID=A0A167W0F3_9AGAM|nr:hypothetical protein FIBSPDRAFT_914864 [Fibularhizoctonia sp. CBS 109695]
MDLFLWPFTQEIWELSAGIHTFDILWGTLFLLCAFLILGFGDIPVVSMVMCMKGHNSFSPCRMCEITGLTVLEAGGTTLYVPLNHTNHPDVNEDDGQCYNPHRLPLHTHNGLLSQAREVQATITVTAGDELAKKYGIKCVPLLLHLPTLCFPASFPFVFLPFFWGTFFKTLFFLWRGNEEYELVKAIWQGLGVRTANSGSMIPLVYGARVPNVATNSGGYVSAEMWSFWTLYLGPILLRH